MTDSQKTTYCIKCKGTREIKNPQPTTLKNGTSAIQGVCPDCGTKLTRLLPRTRPSA